MIMKLLSYFSDPIKYTPPHVTEAQLDYQREQYSQWVDQELQQAREEYENEIQSMEIDEQPDLQLSSTSHANIAVPSTSTAATTQRQQQTPINQFFKPTSSKTTSVKQSPMRKSRAKSMSSQLKSQGK